MERKKDWTNWICYTIMSNGIKPTLESTEIQNVESKPKHVVQRKQKKRKPQRGDQTLNQYDGFVQSPMHDYTASIHDLCNTNVYAAQWFTYGWQYGFHQNEYLSYFC